MNRKGVQENVIIEADRAQPLIFPPWEEVHDFARKVIKRLDYHYRPWELIDRRSFVDQVLSISSGYYQSRKRRRRFKGNPTLQEDMERWLKGNVCLSAAKDVRELILGRKIKEKGVDSSECKRRDPATGLPGPSVPIEVNRGSTKKPLWTQIVDLPYPSPDRHREIMQRIISSVVIDGAYGPGVEFRYSIDCDPEEDFLWRYRHVRKCPDCYRLFKQTIEGVKSGTLYKDHAKEVRAIVKKHVQECFQGWNDCYLEMIHMLRIGTANCTYYPYTVPLWFIVSYEFPIGTNYAEIPSEKLATIRASYR